VIDRSTHGSADGLRHGAYVLREADGGTPDALLIATGSEVALALAAQALLAARGVAARVVSMPSWELFAAQPQAYRDAVLPPQITRRVAIEAGVSMGWQRWAGDAGTIIAVDTFGASAPYQEIYRQYGLTPERIAAVL
jgi:transketolase